MSSTTTSSSSSKPPPSLSSQTNGTTTSTNTNGNTSQPATSTVLYSGLLYTPNLVNQNSSRRPSTPNISCKEYYTELYAQVTNTTNLSKSISLSSLGTMFAYYTGTLSSSSAPQVQHFLNLFEKVPSQYIESLGLADQQEPSFTDNSFILPPNRSSTPSTSSLLSNDNPTPSVTLKNNIPTNSSTNNLKSSVQQHTNNFLNNNSSLPILSESMKPSLQIPLNNVAIGVS